MALKVWNGSSWVSATGLKVWNGSSWVTASNGKVWNGSAWTTFFTSSLDFRTVTPGYLAAPKGGVAYYGYSKYTGNPGSISPSSNSTLSGHNARIFQLRASEVVSSTSYLEFYLEDSGNGTNSGFTTMTVANNTTSLSFSRTSATFSNSSINSSTSSAWSWSGSSGPGDMFIAAYAAGATVNVTWT